MFPCWELMVGQTGSNYWICYDAEAQSLLNTHFNALMNGQSNVHVFELVTTASPTLPDGSALYVIDLSRNIQINVKTKYERAIRRRLSPSKETIMEIPYWSVVFHDGTVVGDSMELSVSLELAETDAVWLAFGPDFGVTASTYPGRYVAVKSSMAFYDKTVRVGDLVRKGPPSLLKIPPHHGAAVLSNVGLSSFTKDALAKKSSSLRMSTDVHKAGIAVSPYRPVRTDDAIDGDEEDGEDEEDDEEDGAGVAGVVACKSKESQKKRIKEAPAGNDPEGDEDDDEDGDDGADTGDAAVGEDGADADGDATAPKVKTEKEQAEEHRLKLRKKFLESEKKRKEDHERQEQTSDFMEALRDRRLTPLPLLHHSSKDGPLKLLKDGGVPFEVVDEHEEGDCCVCLCPLFDEDDDGTILPGGHRDDNVVVRLPCVHYYHAGCVGPCLKNNALQCPTCTQRYGITPMGTMPDGTMDIVEGAGDLAGFPPGSGCIQIVYNFPSGKQGPHHPHPGSMYHGTSRSALLPNTREGRKVLKLLKKAFLYRHTFTVGHSITLGPSAGDRVVWAGIHHKTSSSGTYGYPDPTYLTRVEQELAGFGVTLWKD